MNEQIQIHKKTPDWKSVTVRLKENDVAILNSKLKMNRFKTFSAFVHAWIDDKYSIHQKDEQIEKLINRLRAKDIKDPLTEELSPPFYKNIDREEMFQEL